MCRAFLKKYWLGCLVATLLAIVLGGISSVFATLIGPAIQVLLLNDPSQVMAFDELVGTRLGTLATWFFSTESFNRQQMLAALPIAIIGVCTLKAVVTASQWFIWENTGEKVSRDVRQHLIQKYLRLDTEKKLADVTIDQELSGVLSTDVRYLREYIVRFYGGLPREGLQCLFLVFTLIALSPQLFLVFLLGVAPLVVIVNRLGKKLRRRANHALKDYSILTEWLQQRLLGVETIKHYGVEAVEVKKMQQLNDRMYLRFLKAARIKARTSPLIEGVAVAALAGVLYISFQQVSLGESTGAIHLSFFSTLAILSQSAGKLGKYYNSNREGSAAISRIEALSLSFDDKRLNVAVPVEVQASQLEIELDQVEVRYPQEERSILKDFSYRFQPGVFYCLCGASGAGKSTLFNLMLGVLRPQAGTVVYRTPDAEATEILGYMPQDAKPICSSIAANVSYPHTDIDFAKVKEVIKSVQLTEAVEELPQGYETVVGAGGKEFSGGQAQRLHLARLLYHGCNIILVDEGTSALDPENEKLVLDLFKSFTRKGAIVVMIAHRIAAMRASDQIVYLQDGRVEMDGLMAEVWEMPKFKAFLGRGEIPDAT